MPDMPVRQVTMELDEVIAGTLLFDNGFGNLASCDAAGETVPRADRGAAREHLWTEDGALSQFLS